MGVENIITFDAHDPRVQNAVPLLGFENVQPSYQLVKAMIKNVPDLIIDKDHLMCISPDEGGMGRCIFNGVKPFFSQTRAKSRLFKRYRPFGS